MTLREIIKLMNSLPEEDKDQKVSFSICLGRLEIHSNKTDNTDKTEGELECCGKV